MHILYVFALPGEQQILQNVLRHSKPESSQVQFLCVWKWPDAMMVRLTRFLSTLEVLPDVIVNIWVCGYISTQLEVPVWCIQIQTIRQLYTNKEIVVPYRASFAKTGHCITSPHVVFDAELLSSYTMWDFSCIDMEAYACAYIAQQFAIPYCILKVPVDRIWQETHDFDIKQSLDMLAHWANRSDLWWFLSTHYQPVQNLGTTIATHYAWILEKLHFTHQQKRLFLYEVQKRFVLTGTYIEIDIDDATTSKDVIKYLRWLEE